MNHRIFTVLITVSLTVILLPLLNSNVNALTVNNTEFSVSVLDNWAYTKSNPLADAFAASWLGLIPTEFSDFLVNTSRDISGETIQSGGAYSIMSLDSNYPYRNVPLEIYAQYNVNLYKVKVFSKENTTVDTEPAVKIHRSPRNNFTNIEVVEYYVIHNGNPYTLQYAANVKDFQKYLPQFEQMVKTFKFTK